jgi:hypothetical protein
MKRKLISYNDIDNINNIIYEQNIKDAQIRTSLPFVMFTIIAIGWFFSYCIQPYDQDISAYLFFGSPAISILIKILSKLSLNSRIL